MTYNGWCAIKPNETKPIPSKMNRTLKLSHYVVDISDNFQLGKYLAQPFTKDRVWHVVSFQPSILGISALQIFITSNVIQ